MTSLKKYKSYTLRNYLKIPQIRSALNSEEIEAIKIVGKVLPFKTNNYVVDELIDWNDLPNDPMFQLTFPQKGMLTTGHFNKMKFALQSDLSKAALYKLICGIRRELNPNPAGQETNIPILNDTRLTGIQHKYKETVLFFPSSGQTCHAYCTFCFRWPQFVGMGELKFAMKETDLLIQYLRKHPKVTDVLFSGGDPMIMSTKKIKEYIEPLLNSNLETLKNIRIGTKTLSYWPYRYLTDKDSDELLRLFKKITKKGYHLALMAHFNHPNELKTKAVQGAIKRILNTGAIIRTQSPIMNNINSSAEAWAEMWKLQVKLGCVPYYMFVARDTGAQDYFAVTLENAWKIYRNAYKQVSGLARTVRGPSMSAGPGKIQILGINEIANEKIFVLRFLQGRNPDWVGRPFFAKYDAEATWLSDLEPLDDKNVFFFDNEIEPMKLIAN